MSRFAAPIAAASGPGVPVIRDRDGAYWEHWCPGCDDTHLIPVPRWSFNGDVVRPTFTPSVRITWGSAPGSRQCHYNITNGEIFFHGDSTHKCAGQTLPLRPIPADE